LLEVALGGGPGLSKSGLRDLDMASIIDKSDHTLCTAQINEK
jgi:hypothetical protein